MTSTPSASNKNLHSSYVRSSNQGWGVKNQINRASNNGQANKKLSYLVYSAYLGSSMFYISNIKQANNFNTAYKATIAYIQQEYTHVSNLAEDL